MKPKDLKRLAPPREAADGSRVAAARLADRAVAEGLVDVALATMDSPVGELLVAVTPRGLVAVSFEDEGRERTVARLTREVSPRVMEAAAPTDEAASPSRAAVATSIALIRKQPSPVRHTTWRSGRTRWAPMAAGTAQPIDWLSVGLK